MGMKLPRLFLPVQFIAYIILHPLNEFSEFLNRTPNVRICSFAKWMIHSQPSIKNPWAFERHQNWLLV